MVDLTAEPPRLLRPGALTLRELRTVLPDIARRPTPAGRRPPARARARACWSATTRPAPPYRCTTASRRYLTPRVRIRPAPRGLLTYQPPGAAATLYDHVELLADEPQAYAADLYSALHRLDEAGMASIAALAPPKTLAWHAITDCLTRAAAAKPS